MGWKNYDHPLDVIDFLLGAVESGDPIAIGLITGTTGGSIRSVGSIVGLGHHSGIAGHISNGCLDQNLILEARQAIHTGLVRDLSFGAGSPYKDLRLPCGGSVTIRIIPSPDPVMLRSIKSQLENRQDLTVLVDKDGTMTPIAVKDRSSGWDQERRDMFRLYISPPLMIRIAGVGAEMKALIQLAVAAGFRVMAQSPENDFLGHDFLDNDFLDHGFLGQVQAQGMVKSEYLSSSSPPSAEDDEWTAFVLMFHDHDQEAELLRAALRGSAFYIGALGSRKTHSKRCDTLRAEGINEEEIRRIHGPLGLVPSLRHSAMVAASCLAEIIAVYSAKK